MSFEGSRAGDDRPEPLLDHYFELLELPVEARTSHWLEMMTSIGVAMKRLGPYALEVRDYVEAIKQLLSDPRHRRLGPVQHLLDQLDRTPFRGHSQDTARAALPAAEPLWQDLPPTYTASESSKPWLSQAAEPAARYNSTAPFQPPDGGPASQRRTRLSTSSLTDQDITDKGNTLVNDYFELLEVPDQNRHDRWRSDMRGIASKLDQLGSAASSLAITAEQIQVLIEQSRTPASSINSFSTQELLHSLQTPQGSEHAAEVEYAESVEDEDAELQPTSPSVEDISDVYWELLEVETNDRDESWRAKMEALACQLETMDEPQLGVTAEQVRRTIMQSPTRELEATPQLVNKLHQDPSGLDRLIEIFPQHSRAFLTAQLSAAFNDLEDAVHLVECQGQGSVPRQASPKQPQSSLDRLAELFPQHPRSLLSAQLHAAFGDLEDAAHLVQRHEFEQQPMDAAAEQPSQLSQLSPQSERQPQLSSHASQLDRRRGRGRNQQATAQQNALSFHTGAAIPAGKWNLPPGLSTTPSLVEVQEETQHHQWHQEVNESAIRFKLLLLQRLFPDDNPAVLRHLLENNNYDVEACAAIKLEADEDAPREVHATGPVISTAALPPASTSPAMSRKELAWTMTQHDESDELSVQHWRDKRERYRNQLSGARGTPGVTAHLTDQIKHCTEQLRAASSREANGIVGQHNDVDVIHRRLDLHGLYVREALEKVKQLLQWHRQRRARLPGPDSIRHVELITGAGRHSADGKPRLKPEIERWLNSQGYTYTLLNEGTIRVNLSSI